MENIVIIGSGPAGLTAAIYAARAELKPLVLEGVAPGGQLIVSAEVENYPGFVDPVHGMELMDTFRKQAVRLGARMQTTTVNEVKKMDDGTFVLTTGEGDIATKTVVVATGAQARRLPISAEEKYYGRGVSGCATCDGAFFREKHVLVVGGGNTAIEDALFLTRFAAKVTIVHRREQLRADAVEVSKAKAHAKIEWMIPWVVEDIKGDMTVSSAVLKNRETGEEKEIACDGIFVAIGHIPQTDIFKELVGVDDEGYISTEEDSSRTKVPGIFACGDVSDRVYKQAVVAAGAGCKAALDVEKYLGHKD